MLTFRVYAMMLWNTGPNSKDASETVGSLLGDLETTRRVLAVMALLWCAWSWRKEWWLPSAVATLCAALALYVAFIIDS